ncbi:UNVERIFIED_CONTAM: hypothetical protein NCL1_63666 [Trichonephila clavipes]
MRDRRHQAQWRHRLRRVHPVPGMHRDSEQRGSVRGRHPRTQAGRASQARRQCHRQRLGTPALNQHQHNNKGRHREKSGLRSYPMEPTTRLRQLRLLRTECRPPEQAGRCAVPLPRERPDRAAPPLRGKPHLCDQWRAPPVSRQR